MNCSTLLLIATLLLSPAAFAKKAKRNGKRAGGAPIVAVLKQFDKNGNRQIDGDEAAALKAAVSSAKPGSVEKKLDRNGDGVLDDGEITAVNARTKGKAAGGAKKRKKKNS